MTEILKDIYDEPSAYSLSLMNIVTTAERTMP
jgi:hypothetical protein